MIRTLIVDDDFRVARLHATSVERIEGFECVGEAHTAAEARTMIEQSNPDLLILDIYLPDEDGLSLLRSLTAEGQAPDTIFITAARDVDSVRAAMGLGAVYYLVKPFGLHQLRDQLQAYRQWRAQLSRVAGADTDQATVDTLYNLLRGPSPNEAHRRRLPPTMAKVYGAVANANEPLAASRVADELGLSRTTAMRYLTELERRGLIELELVYGTTGRPIHRYRPSQSTVG